MPLERYEGPPRLRRAQSSATLQESGKITLTEQAAKDLGQPVGLTVPEAVELYFDRERRIIGMRAVPRGTPHSYAARKQTYGTTVVLTALSFFHHYGIDLGGTSRRFTAYMDNDLLCVDLNAESEVVVGPRTLRRNQRSAAATSENPPGTETPPGPDDSTGGRHEQSRAAS
jgi:hypothetical protein